MAGSIYGGVQSGPGGVFIEISPPAQFIERQAAEFAVALSDLMPLWERLKPVMESIEQDVFSTQGHGQWPPLAESTIQQKTRQGYPLDPLVRTGALKQSLTSDAASRMTPNSFTFGTDSDYAFYHQEGGSVEGRPPQRKLIDVDNINDRRKLEAAVVAWVNAVVRSIWR